MKIFDRQIWHLLILVLLIAGIITFVHFNSELLAGSFWGIKTKTWLIIALATPIVHQVYGNGKSGRFRSF